MLLGPLAVAVLCVGLDWAVWDWAIGSDHGTVALIAGLGMAPLVIALAWYGALAAAALLRLALDRAARTTRLRLERRQLQRVQGPSVRPRHTPPRADREAAAQSPSDRLAA